MLTQQSHRVFARLPDGSIRYGIKSVGGLAVGLTLLTGWVELIGIPPQLAIFLNFIVMGVLGCLVLDRWVFQDTAAATTLRGFTKRFIGTQSAMASGKAVNYIIFIGLLELDIIYQAAWVAGAVVSFGLTFVTNRWVFRSIDS